MGLVIIQARVSSERLPGKVLLPILGKPVLSHVIKRAEAAGIGKVILAIPDKAEDDPLEKFAQENSILYYRGSEKDVLDRYYRAALLHSPDYVVRITSDCPCLDSAVTKNSVEFFKEKKADYVSSASREIFYHGTDTEVFTFQALKEAAERAEKDYEREHVTPYIRENSKFIRFTYGDGLKADSIVKSIRATLDTKEDYIVIKAIFDLLGDNFSHDDVLSLFRRYPWLSEINGGVVQKAAYHSPEDELREAVRLLRLQELKRAADYLAKMFPL
jgi:spore coat polysaccharide biosynthesis protein SpsF